ncbi:hypothetical protein IC235_19060 [Hymenobacter sp. BT664]|uniref:Uncharacterized protein n=1 Tax=Hymenobacter montanus TaxID=2771359 RepID=A0A927GKW6_9BACT|nr:hypothetical protein [Hymenobacter montanus]MBD2769992.1 hypothetical protein [Hymenobacter montanus]
MSKIDQVINLIQHQPLTDLLLVGYIDQDDTVKRFNPIHTEVYLEFGLSLLHCSSVDQYDKLRMRIVDKIALAFDFEIEEGNELGICSIFEMYLFDPYGTNQITAAQLLLDEECDLDEGVVKCAGFNIGSKDYLFLDPTHTFGVQINGKRSIKEWIERNVHRTPKYREFVWDRSEGKTELKSISLIT